MIRCKCKKCGAVLESPDEMAGQVDICPDCRTKYYVPTPKLRHIRKHFVIGVVVIVAVCLSVVMFWYVRKPAKSRNQVDNDKYIEHKKGEQNIHVEFLEERWGFDAAGGYYVWCLISPMTEPELNELGRQLLARMRSHKGDHLKASLYYNKDDYDSRSEYRKPCAIWLNAVRPDFEIRIYGPIPRDHSRQACFEAYIESDPMIGLRQDGKSLIQCEYDPKESHLIFYDKLVGTFSKPLHIQAIVVNLIDQYLPGEMSPVPWTTIPGIKKITVHFYDKDATQPTITVSFDRDVYEKAVPLYRNVCKVVSDINQIEVDAFMRLRASVISEQEYRDIADAAARQIYDLYESLWVEVSPLVEIETYKPLAKNPPRYPRKYFFGD